ncbi:ABC transporter ATP-binding protein [Anaerolineae bacterium CFX7]|nr:ABC transporter ATP-binding protein [Anaerolineae bacterium CFX7]
MNEQGLKAGPLTTTQPAIQIREVSKKLRGRQVLHKIDLDVEVGASVGIFGTNGSGKSMLLRVISGLVLADQGSVRVLGKMIGRDSEFPQSLGALIDGPGFLLESSGLANLELLASIQKRISRAEIRDALALVGLDPNDRRPVKAYSTGMRQRLGIAQAIMEHPKILLLDEPTSALDPNGAAVIHSLLEKMQKQGVTMILVSHNRAELGDLCNAVHQMQAGALLSP